MWKMSQESLKNKTIKGVGWSAVDNVVQHAVPFVVGIVLARLLSPDDDNLSPCHRAADMGNVKDLIPGQF